MRVAHHGVQLVELHGTRRGDKMSPKLVLHNYDSMLHVPQCVLYKVLSLLHVAATCPCYMTLRV